MLSESLRDIVVNDDGSCVMETHAHGAAADYDEGGYYTSTKQHLKQ